ncbi:helix-turn-helix domain-containing protein [Microbacterium arborescens]|jgi:AraC-like DNA-binding protein|uniref:helix-turn-helix domain-containing protein n=1 Tax=Microbacterium TaxID=33882 RepID=UPI0025A0EFF3|nr:helix-turn-helix domain-containing protein [Microbacterium arborescens]WJM15485.1 helix-turn-helix domain-containing protein [Microbacterium arborescens]
MRPDRPLIARGEFELNKFRADGREKLLSLMPLTTYMSSANIGFTAVRDDNALLRANVVRVGAYLFTHARMPAATVVWPRDERSRNRVVAIVAEGRALQVRSDAPVVARRSSSFLIPPGTAPVTIEAAEPTELVFISLDAGDFASRRRMGFDRISRSGADEAVIRPLVTFVKALCAIESDVVEMGGSPLGDAAAEVSVALVASLIGDTPPELSLPNAVMDILVREYASPTLSLSSVANRLGVSTRTVQSALSAQGRTFSESLLEIRLRAATELRRHNPTMTLDLVARATGFGTRQSLHRAMRKVDESST